MMNLLSYIFVGIIFGSFVLAMLLHKLVIVHSLRKRGYSPIRGLSVEKFRQELEDYKEFHFNEHKTYKCYKAIKFLLSICKIVVFCWILIFIVMVVLQVNM